MRRMKGTRRLASVLALALFAAACGNGDGRASSTDSDSTASYVSRFGVDTAKCPDELVDGHLGAIIPIGTTMPLSGGPATVYEPLADGLDAYAAYANERGLVGDRQIQLTVEDDRLDPGLTRPAVLKLLELKRVALLTGMFGTETNLALRDLLNQECYPQLFASSASPELGDAERFPWTSGGLLPANTETALYVADAKARFPNGATVGYFGVDGMLGDVYERALNDVAAGARLDVVARQTVASDDGTSLAAPVASIAAAKPDVVLAAPLGTQCTAFVEALGRARAADPAWRPVVYVASGCATPALLREAGTDADGVVSASSLVDVNDPALAEEPAVRDMRETLVANGFPRDGDFATAAIGWTEMEATVEVLMNAAATSGGLTRASIMNAARDLTFTPSLARPGVTWTTLGTGDPFVLESAQLVRWDAVREAFVDQGPVVTAFEGKTGRPS